MTVRIDKKAKKMRGSKTHGYGCKKKHRGAGSKGGHGYAGSHKHKWTKIMKEEPDHFGKKGFIRPAESVNPVFAMNVCDLEMFEGDEIDLSALGFDKLLGKGSVSRKVSVRTASFTAKAKEKVEKAGGKIITEQAQ